VFWFCEDLAWCKSGCQNAAWEEEAEGEVSWVSCAGFFLMFPFGFSGAFVNRMFFALVFWQFFLDGGFIGDLIFLVFLVLWWESGNMRRWKLFGGRLGVPVGAAPSRRGLGIVFRYVFSLLGLVTLYSVLFHWVMVFEGRQYSWVTGFYWTLTTMSTLGFGDIVFHSDLGRAFSILVLASGVLLLVVMMPFVFLRFVYAPFLESQKYSRSREALPRSVSGHLVLTGVDVISRELAFLCLAHGVPVVFLVPELPLVADLEAEFGERVFVLCGGLDDPQTYRRAAVHRAVMVVVLNNDYLSATIGATLRGVSPSVCLVGHADAPESVEVLSLAGFTHILEFHKELALGLSERILGMTPLLLGRFGDFLIVEWRLNGRGVSRGGTLAGLLGVLPSGVVALGVWEKGVFSVWDSSSQFLERAVSLETVVLLGGSASDLGVLFGEVVGVSASQPESAGALTVILGAGRVGRALGDILSDHGCPFVLVDKSVDSVSSSSVGILGNAASREVLEGAGLSRATSVVVTTHEEDWNVYLTVFCRKLRPDIYILSRAVSSRREPAFYRAGADLVMSYGFVASRKIFGWMRPSDVLVLFGGVCVGKYRLRSRLEDFYFLSELSLGFVAVYRGSGWVFSGGPFLLGEEVLIVGPSVSHPFLSRWGLRAAL
jgi:Trk K+ transport system NAD-binding subunit